jgi:hypothetical protein
VNGESGRVVGVKEGKQVEGQSRVVWSPLKFVLGVRRTTNGVARSMNINTTFLLDGRDVPFLRSFNFKSMHTFDRIRSIHQVSRTLF